jgi:hypothetical protein
MTATIAPAAVDAARRLKSRLAARLGGNAEPSGVRRSGGSAKCSVAAGTLGRRLL